MPLRLCVKMLAAICKVGRDAKQRVAGTNGFARRLVIRMKPVNDVLGGNEEIKGGVLVLWRFLNSF